MVIIDTKNDIAHESVSKAEAARIVGVDPSTVFRWAKISKIQEYNHFKIYFKTIKHKQNKGSSNPSFRRG